MHHLVSDQLIATSKDSVHPQHAFDNLQQLAPFLKVKTAHNLRQHGNELITFHQVACFDHCKKEKGTKSTHLFQYVFPSVAVTERPYGEQAPHDRLDPTATFDCLLKLLIVKGTGERD
ncbi:hypothetical protein N0V95_007500 [Ascochyta clinopodiicola]|nr:hypothetical protein N0V95_007500 [Ascochyta clinopodiicola]